MRREPTSLQLYVSGFMGASVVANPAYTRPVRTLGANLMNLVVEPNVERARNARIDQLHTEWLDRNKRAERCEIELAFFEEAVNVLSVKNLTHWIYLQEQSPMFTQTHRDFIEDTLQFISTGKRTIHCTSWLTLFKYGSPISGTSSLSVKQEKIRAYEQAAGTAGLTDVLVRWLSREGGVADFIQSFHLMYGSILTN